MESFLNVVFSAEWKLSYNFVPFTFTYVWGCIYNSESVYDQSTCSYFSIKKNCVWGKRASLLRPGVAKNYFPVPTPRFLFRYSWHIANHMDRKYIYSYIAKVLKKKDFKCIRLYDSGKVVGPAHIRSANVWWRRILHK